MDRTAAICDKINSICGCCCCWSSSPCAVKCCWVWQLCNTVIWASALITHVTAIVVLASLFLTTLFLQHMLEWTCCLLACMYTAGKCWNCLLVYIRFVAHLSEGIVCWDCMRAAGNYWNCVFVLMHFVAWLNEGVVWWPVCMQQGNNSPESSNLDLQLWLMFVIASFCISRQDVCTKVLYPELLLWCSGTDCWRHCNKLWRNGCCKVAPKAEQTNAMEMNVRVGTNKSFASNVLSSNQACRDGNISPQLKVSDNCFADDSSIDQRVTCAYYRSHTEQYAQSPCNVTMQHIVWACGSVATAAWKDITRPQQADAHAAQSFTEQSLQLSKMYCSVRLQKAAYADHAHLDQVMKCRRQHVLTMLN